MNRRRFLSHTGQLGLAAGAAAALEDVVPGEVWAAPSGAREGAGATVDRLATPDRFDYLPIVERPLIKWPNGARVALWVAPNVEFYEYLPRRSPTRPEVPSYSYRDRGNRHGFWRMLDVLDKHAIRACACLNAGVLDHCPEIREAMVARNWDYMAHGFYNTRPITDYTVDEEREYWRDIIAAIDKHTGKRLKGRLGAGGGNTLNTPDLMAEF